MTLETASDGSIQVRDRFVFLRAGLLVSSASFLGMAAMQRLYALDQVRAVWASLVLALGCAALAAVIIRYWISRNDQIAARALAVSTLHMDSEAAARLIEELAPSSRTS